MVPFLLSHLVYYPDVVVLSLQFPLFPLTKAYKLEKKKVGGDWEKVADLPGTAESATIPNLEEGEEYEFRVAAVTDAGPGDFSLASGPVKAEKKKRKFSVGFFSESPTRESLLCNVINVAEYLYGTSSEESLKIDKKMGFSSFKKMAMESRVAKLRMLWGGHWGGGVKTIPEDG